MSSYEGDPRQLNTDYGSGIYRRRIASHSSPGEELAELEDGPHGFRLRLLHGGETITGAQPQALRYPFITCATDGHLLQLLQAKPLALSQDAAGFLLYL